MSPLYIYSYIMNSKTRFFVKTNDNLYYSNDEAIANLIDLRFDKYAKLIESFGAILHQNNCQYFFEYKNEAENFMNYLNETYLIILKLQGKI